MSKNVALTMSSIESMYSIYDAIDTQLFQARFWSFFFHKKKIFLTFIDGDQ